VRAVRLRLHGGLFKVTSERYPAWFFTEWVQVHLEEFHRIAAFKATKQRAAFVHGRKGRLNCFSMQKVIFATVRFRSPHRAYLFR
jgi:hypothetical protein